MLTSQQYEELASDLAQAICVAAFSTKLDASITGPGVEHLKAAIKRLISALDK